MSPTGVTLVFDTTNRWIVLGLFGEGLEKELRLDTAREASHRLVPEIRNLLAHAKIKKPERIICALGPGSFTGARICVGTARNLAQLWDIPVFGVDSLLYYCYALVPHGPVAVSGKKDLTKTALLIDGKQRRVYARLIDPNRGFAHYHEQTARFEKNADKNRTSEQGKDTEAKLKSPGHEGLQDIAPLDFFQALESGVEASTSVAVFADDPSTIQEYMEKDPRNQGTIDTPDIRRMTPPGARALYELGLLLGAREAHQDWRELSPIYLRRDPATAKFPRGLK